MDSCCKRKICQNQAVLLGFMFFSRSEIFAGALGANWDKHHIQNYFDLPVKEDCIDSSTSFMSEKSRAWARQWCRPYCMGSGECPPPIINMVCAAGYGATFVLALSSAVVSFVCYAFIDDTDLVHTRPGHKHQGQDLIPEMQEAVDHWEGGLRASGGTLVPTKKKKLRILLFSWYP
jgi:hypothetical protein